MKKIAILPLVLLAALALASCGGSSTDTLTWSYVQPNILETNTCASVCHSGSPEFSMEIDQYTAIVTDGMVSQFATGGLIVKPLDSANSFLMRKINGDLATGEGTQMLISAAPMDAADQQIIADWIDAGAPQ